MIFILLIILAAIGSQAFALWFYREGSRSAANWALVGCLLVIAVALILELPVQFVPATYETQTIRQFVFFSHFFLVGVECLIVMVGCLSGNVNFLVLWWLSSTVIVAFLLTFLFPLSWTAI